MMIIYIQTDLYYIVYTKNKNEKIWIKSCSTLRTGAVIGTEEIARLAKNFCRHTIFRSQCVRRGEWEAWEGGKVVETQVNSFARFN